ncbi:MAG: oxidoreductase [Marmoricola sp.]|nr:oxidoreductase [Marmoricola sp.]
MITVARSIAPGSALSADVCVIGAGAAGLALAGRLEAAGRSVVLLESGLRRPSAVHQRLNDGDVVGHHYRPLNAARFRLLGGSTNRWGGWCRPLDPFDLERHDWVPRSGWPIDHADLARHREATNDFLMLPRDSFAGPEEPEDLGPLDAVAGSGLETTTYRFSPLKRSMGAGYEASLHAARHVTLVLDATVTDLRLDPGTSRLGHVEVTTSARATWTVRARHFVLATGGLENPRTLLNARNDRPAGLGNEHDVVGRHFIEHVHSLRGYLLTEDPTLTSDFFARTGSGPTGVACGALAGSVATMREHQLMALSLTITPPPHHFETLYYPSPGVDAVSQRLLRAAIPKRPTPAGTGPAGEEQAVLRSALGSLLDSRAQRRFAPTQRRLVAQAAAHGLEQAGVRTLYARGDQVPDPESRVTLADTRDRFGQRRAQLDWRVSAADLDNVDRWMERLDRACQADGRSVVVHRADWRDHVEGGPHHSGTTRMSADPRTGVVDADCRVHSVDNLFVAGSSVFPTGGYANPTYPLVALALRLADHLTTLDGPVRVADPVGG